MIINCNSYKQMSLINIYYIPYLVIFSSFVSSYFLVVIPFIYFYFYLSLICNAARFNTVRCSLKNTLKLFDLKLFEVIEVIDRFEVIDLKLLKIWSYEVIEDLKLLIEIIWSYFYFTGYIKIAHVYFHVTFVLWIILLDLCKTLVKLSFSKVYFISRNAFVLSILYQNMFMGPLNYMDKY